MTHTERRFWEIITWFGTMPGIFVPLGFIVSVYFYDTYQRFTSSINLDLSYIHWDFSLFTDQAVPLILWFWWVFMSYSIGTVIKYLYYKPRPIPRDTSTTRKRINAWSMPSIHTSNAFIISAAILSIVVNQEIYEYQAILLAIFSFLLYISISLSRIALRQHYPIDVLAGTFLWMTIIWTLIVYIDNTISIIEKIIYLFF